MVTSRALVYTKHPKGRPHLGGSFELVTSDVDISKPPPNGIIARTHYVSYDIWQLDRMSPPGAHDYVPSFPIGEPITNTSVISVIASDNPRFKPDMVLRWFGRLEEYVSVTASELDEVEVINNPHKLPWRYFVGVLGLVGLTGYSSFYAIAQPKQGQTLFVSAAAGAVGQLIVQLGKIEGMRVIGSAGGKDKVEFVKGLGAEVFDYKSETARDALKRLAPDGIDVYYDNVGGDHLEAAIEALKSRGTIVGSGMVSQGNKPLHEQYPIRNLVLLYEKRIKMQGFLVLDEDMGPKYTKEHEEKVSAWIAQGKWQVKENVVSGIEQAEKGLLDVFDGKHFGKSLLEVAPLEG